MNIENSNILSINLVECIDKIRNYDNKIKEYEEELNEKEIIINQLEIKIEQLETTIEQLIKDLKQNSNSKEIKKALIKLEKTIERYNNNLKNNDDNTMKVINSVKVDLNYIKNEVDKQFILANSTDKKLGNGLNKVAKELCNTIINSIVSENRKLIKEINKSISKELDIIIKNTEKDDMSVVKVEEEQIKNHISNEYKERKAIGVEEFSSELDDLLDGAI